MRGEIGIRPLCFLGTESSLSEAIGEMEELVSGTITEQGLSERLGVEATLSWILDILRGEATEGVRFFLLMLSVGILCTLSSVLCQRRSELGRSVGASVQIILAVCVWSALSPLLLDAIETVRELSRLCTLALPIFIGVHTATGAGESALSTAAGLGGLLSVFEGVIAGLFLPLYCLYLGVCLLGGMGDEAPVGRFAKQLYRLFLSAMGFFTVAVSSVMSLQSALAGAKDSLLLRTVRHATGSMIPVVGSTVSGTLSALLAGGAYVKETVGTMALIGLLSVSLPLLCRLLLCRMAAGVLALLPLSFSEDTGILDTVRRALDLLIALVSMAVSLFLLSVVLFLRSGRGGV